MNIFSKTLNWKILISFVLLTTAFFGYLSFESDLSLKIIMAVLLVGSGFYIFSQKKYDFLNIIILYLIFFDLYNLYLSVGWPLWLITILFVIFTTLLSYLYNMSELNNINKQLYLVYLTLINLMMLEIFLALIPWPTDPKVRAIIVVSLFYFLWGLVNLKLRQQLQFKKVMFYLVIFAIIIFAVVATTKWY